MPGDLSRDVIEAALRGRWGRPSRIFDAVGSTNDVAFEWAASGAPEGAVVVADHQTKGRGRHGRTWIDPPGGLLMFSLVLRPAGDQGRLPLLPTVAGLACAEAVQELTGLEARLKWPNDVIIEGKKLAGILVEHRQGSGPAGGETQAAPPAAGVVVVGCGLNVTWPEEAMPAELKGRATSLSASLGPGTLPPARPELLAGVLAAMERLYPLIGDPSGPKELVRAAEARSFLLGKPIAVSFPDGTSVKGTAKRLLPSGALEIEAEGELRAVHAAEIHQLGA